MLTAKAAHRKDLSGKPATMTHQHFREIARIIRTVQTPHGLPAESEAARRVMYRFADELASTNPNFDRARFLAACQPQED